jgi:hypothetical protein
MDRYGDITTWATEDLNQRLTAVVNAKSSRMRPYYILVITKDGYMGQPAGNSGQPTKTVDLSTKKVVSNRIMILEPWKVPKVPMLGTSLWYVDNTKGLVKCVYVLPLDKPMIGDFEVGGESGLVHKSAQGMPLVYD